MLAEYESNLHFYEPDSCKTMEAISILIGEKFIDWMPYIFYQFTFSWPKWN